MPLPTSRAFVTQLFDSLAENSPTQPLPTASGANVLKDISETTKKQLLSLQVLFPNEFLPALDLLDRSLVTRFILVDDQSKDDQPTTATMSQDDTSHHSNTEQLNLQYSIHLEDTTKLHDAFLNTIYYVRSAQLRPSRFTTSFHDPPTSYEVRLLSWNCTCPAFAFAAFPAIHPEPEIPIFQSYPTHTSTNTNLSEEAKGKETWSFGNISLGTHIPPVCKHLLACMLAEKCKGLFGGFVEEREVGREEAAGWAAGWGD